MVCMLIMAIPDNGLYEDVAYIMLTERICISRDVVYVIFSPKMSTVFTARRYSLRGCATTGRLFVCLSVSLSEVL